MAVEIDRNALCITVRQGGEYGAFYLREGRSRRDSDRADYHYAELSIFSSFGNVGYYWGAMGCEAHKFFDRGDESDYILGKLFGGDYYQFDADETILNLKRRLFRDRRQWDIGPDDARRVYDALRTISRNCTTAEEFYEQMSDYSEDFQSEDEKNAQALCEWAGHPSDIDWGRRVNPQAAGLWKLWPEFVAALKAEAEEKAKCSSSP